MTPTTASQPCPEPPPPRPPKDPPPPKNPPPKPKFADLLATLAVLLGAAYLGVHVVAALT